ncbi:type II secretion system F family protein [Phenylobacterium sp.]|jgi:tight adherence protein C|uniref:type II secretion system F family protein n=1 Tax=Phenylobacterium sp. TaxID=1871053 RepID=UPI003784DF1A
MDLLFIISAAALSLLILGVAIGLIALSYAPGNLRLARVVRGAGRDGQASRAVIDALTRIGEVAGRGGLDGVERESLRARLVQGGFYAQHAVEAFFAIRVATAFGFGLAAMAGVLLLRSDAFAVGLLAIMAAACAGLYLPNLLLRRRIAERRRALTLALPDAVDLMVVCLEAGGTLSSAMQRVETEFRELHPVISEQLSITLSEIQAGSSRSAALNRLATRSASEEIGSLVTMLVQSEALGASVAQTMRVFAEQTRQARYLDAERRASELPVKLAFPLVLFIFPALMNVIFTPLIIRIVRQLLASG